jgi:hypothetical protein
MSKILTEDEIMELIAHSRYVRWVPNWLVRRVVTAVYMECTSFQSSD